ncbi:alpha/beta fold hydrolase [Streptomyces sp. FXJ1.4098]|nr:alpha/beta fold hydrolase [Streptomyces sp. FXJ1.4098]
MSERAASEGAVSDMGTARAVDRASGGGGPDRPPEAQPLAPAALGAPVALSHETHGDGPGLVLLHGVGLDRHLWDRCLPRLAARHRVTLVDLRGHGASPPRQPGCPWPNWRGCRGAAGRPTHIVGFSLGALVAQQLGLVRPELAASLTLVSSVAGRTEEERAAVARRRVLAARDFGASAWAAVDRWFSAGWRAQEPALAQDVLDTLLANDRAPTSPATTCSRAPTPGCGRCCPGSAPPPWR